MVTEVFVFVNPASGGNAAAQFISGGFESLRLRLPVDLDVSDYDMDNQRKRKRSLSCGSCLGDAMEKDECNRENLAHTVQLRFADIREGTSGEKPVFLELKNAIKNQQRPGSAGDNDTTGTESVTMHPFILVVVAGGDGTVMWCVSELWAHGISTERLAIAVVPYGTGNDFARVFGWQRFEGIRPFDFSLRGLRILVNSWMASRVTLLDVWEVDFFVQDDSGKFEKMDSKTRRKRVMKSDGAGGKSEPTKKLNFKMLNYFSMGVESRIGIGFDRYRTKSQSLNKLRYGTEGIKKVLFKRTADIDHLLDTMRSGDTGGDGTAVFNVQSPSLPEAHDVPTLLPCASLIASNIPSFASGLDVWSGSSGGRVGVKGASVANEHDLRNATQQMGDKNLEFMTFGTAAELGFERAIHGLGQRVHQGSGPFQLKFKDELEKRAKTYFQVDGEFFIATRPKRVEIKFHSQIQVLMHPKGDFSKATCL